MNPREVIRVALRALARNKMRTILTMLGIIIGVGAVICTVAIGQGAGEQVQAADSVARRQHDHGLRRQREYGRRSHGQRRHQDARQR